MMTVYPDSIVKNSLAVGEKYQDKVARKIKDALGIEIHYYTSRQDQYNIGESKEGFEVKFDSWVSKSKRLSIEVGEKTRKELTSFSNSGIFRKDNTIYYVQGDLFCFWIFKKSDLLRYVIQTNPPVIEDKPPTIQKFYLDVNTADKLAIRKLYF